MTEVYNDINNLPKDLGDIEFLRNHPQILQKLIDYSTEKSLFPYIIIKTSGVSAGGFSWTYSPEGSAFWINIIRDKNINVFYKKYPKTEDFPDMGDIISRFPVGTVFNNSNLRALGLTTSSGDVKILKNHIFVRQGDDWNVLIKDRGTYTLYYKGQYAEVIKPSNRTVPTNPYLKDYQKIDIEALRQNPFLPKDCLEQNPLYYIGIDKATPSKIDKMVDITIPKSKKVSNKYHIEKLK